jgi:hypothetical protein
MRVDPGFWERGDLSDPLAQRDVGAIFRALQQAGYSQRTIAAISG